MEWLRKYTFPTEASYKDTNKAHYRYNLMVKRFLANGTTTATYYGSLHLEPNKVLVDAIHQLGQRAVVGKVGLLDARVGLHDLVAVMATGAVLQGVFKAM